MDEAPETPAQCNDLTIISGASLTINAGKALTVNGNMDNDGTMSITSSASGTGSLIVQGTASGNIKIERYVSGDYWHYFSAPVSGQALDGPWMSNNSIVSTPTTQFFRWDEATYYWIIYGDDLFVDEAFGAAKGYAATVTSSGDLNFTGTVRTSAVNYAATYNADQGNGFNLVGNPFTSTIAINETAQAEDNFLAHNAGILADDYQAVYIWQETGGYTYGDNDYSVVCNTGFSGEGSSGSILTQDFVQPGQGFMVRVKESNSIVFNTNIRKHGAADFYKSKESWPGVELRIASSEHSNSTIIAFNQNMSDGLDPSYDAAKFKGNPNIALYTRLVEDNGVDFAIQALNDYNIENYVIPVGVDVAESGVFEFSAIQEKLDNYNITLEDRQENTFTNLRWDTYFATINESGTGRFYLHFKEATAIDETAINTLKVYVSGGMINISSNTPAKRIILSNITGQILGIYEGQESIPAPKTAGVYLVSIESEGQRITEKIIIE